MNRSVYGTPGGGYSSYAQSPMHDPYAEPFASPSRSGSYLPSHLFPAQDIPDETYRGPASTKKEYWSSTPTTPSRGSHLFPSDAFSTTPSSSRNVPRLTASTSPSLSDRSKIEPSPLTDKEEAPPTESLYDTEVSRMIIDQSPRQNHNETVSGSPPSSTYQPSRLTRAMSSGAMTTTGSSVRSALNPRNQDSLFQSGTTSKSSSSTGSFFYDDRWVTVFGFPVASTSFVLRHFQGCGDIIECQHGDGNWINIQYRTKLQAQKALTKNGKIITDGLMIGVVPCTDKRVLSNEGVTKFVSDTIPRTTTQQQQQQQPPLLQQQNLYQPASSVYAVEPNPQMKNVPKPQTSWYYKVAEYVFGV